MGLPENQEKMVADPDNHHADPSQSYHCAFAGLSNRAIHLRHILISYNRILSPVHVITAAVSSVYNTGMTFCKSCDRPLLGSNTNRLIPNYFL